MDGACGNPPEEVPCVASWSFCDEKCLSTYEPAFGGLHGRGLWKPSGGGAVCGVLVILR